MQGGWAEARTGAAAVAPLRRRRERVVEGLLDPVDREVETPRQELGELVRHVRSMGTPLVPHLAECGAQLRLGHVEGRGKSAKVGFDEAGAWAVTVAAKRPRLAKRVLEPVGADAQLAGQIVEDVAGSVRAVPRRAVHHLLECGLDVGRLEVERRRQPPSERGPRRFVALLEGALDLFGRFAECVGEGGRERVLPLGPLPAAEIGQRIA